MGASTVQTMVDRIVERVHPIRVVLFGSHSRGQATAQSDVDLLVVLSQVGDKRKAAVEIRRLLADLPVAKDIVVTTPEEIARRGDLPGTVLRSALRDGTVVYEQP
jgi:predicted nucleotidyltransferase